MKISCKFCDWFWEARVPADVFFNAGRHYARFHEGMLEEMHEFDPEALFLLPDTRQEVKP
jgi:hypothetical protein